MHETITITIEKFTQLIENEIRMNILKRTVAKEKVYISLDDLQAMLGVDETGDE